MRNIPWRRKWLPALVFLPGKFHGQRSPSGYSPWDRKESDMTECAHTQPSSEPSLPLLNDSWSQTVFPRPSLQRPHLPPSWPQKQSPICCALTQTPSPPTAAGHRMEPVLWGSSCQKCIFSGTSPMVQWLRLCDPPAWGMGSIPDWGTEIPCALWRGQKKKIKIKQWRA